MCQEHVMELNGDSRGKGRSDGVGIPGRVTGTEGTVKQVAWSKLLVRVPVTFFIPLLLAVLAFMLFKEQQQKTNLGFLNRRMKTHARETRATVDRNGWAADCFALSGKKAVDISDDELRKVTEEDKTFTYFPEIDVLLTTMAKGGSSSIFRTMFFALTGTHWMTSEWRNAQNFAHERWESRAISVGNLPLAEQRRIMTSPLSSTKTLRIAVQRDPYERLISSFKSKIICSLDRHGRKTLNRDYLVPLLREHANMPPSPTTCMNVSEFATALDRVRLYAGKPGFVSSLRSLDKHIRPQEFFFHLIDYHLVIDIADWPDTVIMKPLHDRLPYAAQLSALSNTTHLNKGIDEMLFLPEQAAVSFHRFAMLSKLGVPKYQL